MENVVVLAELFVSQVIAAAQESAIQRTQAALGGAFGVPEKRGPGQARKALAPVSWAGTTRAQKVSRKVAAARKLQGQYLGALRGLPIRERAKLKAVAKAKGVAAAVKMAAKIKGRG